ncbi:MAG: alpha/beta hydrolase [Candidatus Competibacteraceae bacterium]
MSRAYNVTFCSLLALALWFLTTGAGVQSSGRRVDIGGYALSIQCQGRGNPTVLLDAGVGGSAIIWTRVQDSLARTTRVCAYDRAGYGDSDPGPAPRSSSRIAAELRTLLERAGLQPPYLLVGHSFGGYNMRLFASLYPQDTVGLVLVDTPNEGQIDIILPEQLLGQLVGKELLSQVWRPEWLARFSPKDLENIAPLFGMPAKTLHTVMNEMAAFGDSSQEVSAAVLPVELPLVVIMHGQRILPAGDWGDKIEKQWLDLQRQLVARQRHGTVLIARESGHNIPFDQPEVIVAAVRQLLAGKGKS